MSTATAPHGKPPVDKLVVCPKCHETYHESELLTPPYVEYPRVVYKAHPKEEAKAAAEPEPPSDTEIVNSDDELKKAESEGWSKDPPKPKAPAHEHTATAGNAKPELHKR